MSKKPHNSVELQRLADTSNGNMSVPDSHTQIGSMAPLYNTMEDAQTAAKDYRHQQVKAQEEYTHPGPMDPPNEYDIVSDKQRQNTSPGYLHQNNVLYADQFAAQEMKHATLTRSGQQKYTGSTAEEMVKESREGGCGCGNSCLWVMVILVLCFIALLAIAAVVMVVLVIVQVIPVCNCAASPEEVQELRAMVDRLAASLNGTSANVSALSQDVSSLDSRITPAVESAIADRITSDGTVLGLNFSAVLMDFEPYTDCQTSIGRQCSISDAASQCETPQLSYINTDPALNYTRDFRCLRISGSSDQHILATSVIIDEAVNEVYCLCYRVMVEGITTVHEVSCGLQVTRCRSSRDVPVDIVTTSPASRANSEP